MALRAAPSAVNLYLTAWPAPVPGLATIQRWLAAISQAHQVAGHIPPPTSDWLVRQVMAGIQRQLGTAPARKAAIATAELRRLLGSCDRSTLAGQRDAALMLLGFAGGFRRSELVALNWEDLDESEDGLRVNLRLPSRSRRATAGRSASPSFPTPRPARCGRSGPGTAPRVLKLAPSGGDQPAHQLVPGRRRRLSPRGVARIVKRACRRAGLDPERYAGHSLRSGLATAAAAGVAPERAIMRQTATASTRRGR